MSQKASVQTTPATATPKKPILVIDVGHGWRPAQGGAIYDPGARGVLPPLYAPSATPIDEHYVASLYGHALSDALTAQSTQYDVRLLKASTKEKALSLTDRRNYCPDARLFVSIHLNAAEDRTAHGYEVWYYRDNSRAIAEHVIQAMQQAFPDRTSRGVKKRGFTVLTRNNPAILIEVGFISNPVELQYLMQRDPRRRWAHHVSHAILEYLSGGSK